MNKITNFCFLVHNGHVLGMIGNLKHNQNTASLKHFYILRAKTGVFLIKTNIKVFNFF